MAPVLVGTVQATLLWTVNAAKASVGYVRHAWPLSVSGHHFCPGVCFLTAGESLYSKPSSSDHLSQSLTK